MVARIEEIDGLDVVEEDIRGGGTGGVVAFGGGRIALSSSVA